mgnify:CR=1 FL=1
MTFNHYFHSPNLHKNSLIVLSEDDIWITQLNNHTCHRLTIDLGKISNAQFSPDGKHIAFSATSEGSEEVYIIATAGGLAKRLTFLGQRAHVRRWKDLQTIVFSSTHQSPFNSSQLYEIDITGSQQKFYNLSIYFFFFKKPLLISFFINSSPAHRFLPIYIWQNPALFGL